ncbi:MAG TPA: hypothetical protein VN952_04155 [Chthoniobacterales bacterium]|nr:hypothetical protein [Chthoniobacterales bacterium]
MSVAVSKAPVTFSLPIRQRLFGRTEWVAFGLVVGIVLAATPICSLAVPSSSPFYLSTYALTLVGKIMCYALVALSLDLVWGYCGVLSLGHGLFFALGGYAMGMYLMRSIGLDGVYHSPLPDFMVFLDWKALPWFWQGSEHFLYALLLIILSPARLPGPLASSPFALESKASTFRSSPKR